MSDDLDKEREEWLSQSETSLPESDESVELEENLDTEREDLEDNREETVEEPILGENTCPHCNGTGLADYTYGRSANKLCQPCEGTGLLKE